MQQLINIKEQIKKKYLYTYIIHSSNNNDFNDFSKIGYKGIAIELHSNSNLKYLCNMKEYPEIIYIGINNITLPYLKLYLNDNIKILWLYGCYIDKLIIKTNNLEYLKLSYSTISFINNIRSIKILHHHCVGNLIKQKYAKKYIICNYFYSFEVTSKIKYNSTIIKYISPRKTIVGLLGNVVITTSIILYLNSLKLHIEK